MQKIHHILNKIELIKNINPTEFHKFIHLELFESMVENINNKYNDIINQYGGLDNKKEKEFTQKYKGYIFRINIIKMKNELIVNILTHNTNPLYCAIVDIDLENKVGVLHSIGKYKDCTIPPVTINGSGSIILNFILGFMKINKNNFGINRLVLKDNSLKICQHCPKEIILSDMYFLLYNNTWYGKYGFRPFNTYLYKPDEDLTKLYINNQTIIDNAKVKDVKLLQYIEEAIEKYNIMDIDIIKIKHVISIWKDKKLSKLLRMFLKDYDRYCCLFIHVSNELFNELKLRTFHQMSFYLDL